jgi:hypothetical protein
MAKIRSDFPAPRQPAVDPYYPSSYQPSFHVEQAQHRFSQQHNNNNNNGHQPSYQQPKHSDRSHHSSRQHRKQEDAYFVPDDTVRQSQADYLAPEQATSRSGRDRESTRSNSSRRRREIETVQGSQPLVAGRRELSIPTDNATIRTVERIRCAPLFDNLDILDDNGEALSSANPRWGVSLCFILFIHKSGV